MLIILATILLLVIFPHHTAPSVTWSERGYVLPEDLGVFHVTLPGTIPADNSSRKDAKLVVLHAFVRGPGPQHDPPHDGGHAPRARRRLHMRQTGNATTVIRGFFFVEAVSNAKLNDHGAIAQPLELLKTWRFPVSFSDHVSGQTHRAEVDTRQWHVQNAPLLPVPFVVTFQGPVSCVDVSESLQ